MSAKRGLPAKIANLERELAFLRADMAKEVTARVELILQARSIVDAEFDPGASVAGIKAATVSAVRGPAFIDGKCDAYIEAHFDALLEQAQASPDPVRLALMGVVQKQH